MQVILSKGTIFSARGKQFKVKRINGDLVYASRMLDKDHCQRGRPSKFNFDEMADILNVSVVELEQSFLSAQVAKKQIAPRPIEYVAKDGEKVTCAQSPSSKLPKIPPKIVTPEEEAAIEEEERIRAEKIARLLGMIDDKSTDDNW